MEVIFLADIQATLSPKTRFPLHIGQRVTRTAECLGWGEERDY